jgi:hypothetical protein
MYRLENGLQALDITIVQVNFALQLRRNAQVLVCLNNQSQP